MSPAQPGHAAPRHRLALFRLPPGAHSGVHRSASGRRIQSGLLTGAFSAERAAGLPADDWRSAHHDFTSGLAANLRLADALRPVAERHGATVAETAIAWALAWPGVTGAIVGARRTAQVDGWIGAGSVRLTPADLDEIAVAITTSGAGTGPARP
ncbi:aldo/keto reductase [Streptomyces sp. NPDC059122]|uniref:aldo/keto reductase n=1 Tax=Streptomyces sp. NPDC059122 TaxID=3346732 RepID=UPI0036C0AF2A